MILWEYVGNDTWLLTWVGPHGETYSIPGAEVRVPPQGEGPKK